MQTKKQEAEDQQIALPAGGPSRAERLGAATADVGTKHDQLSLGVGESQSKLVDSDGGKNLKLTEPDAQLEDVVHTGAKAN